MQHRNAEVRQAIGRLDDALCHFERCTSIESVFILREVGGFVHHSMDGKPVTHNISDQELLAFVG